MGLYLSQRSEPVSLCLLINDVSPINTAACNTSLPWAVYWWEDAGAEIMLWASHIDTYLLMQMAPGIKASFSVSESPKSKDAFLTQDLLCWQASSGLNIPSISEGCKTGVEYIGWIFGQPYNENAPSAKWENAHMKSSLNLNLYVPQIQGCSILALLLQLISDECDSFK